MSELILIRGHSGSGKTTMAENLMHMSGIETHHFEADMFFMTDGGYEFDITRLKDAHEDCQDNVEMSMRADIDRIIVSNTFTRMWEMQPYLDMAIRNGYDVRVVRMTGDYPNDHDVPDHVVEQQKQRMEDYPNETLNSL